jgi:hypothetical protein
MTNKILLFKPRERKRARRHSKEEVERALDEIALFDIAKTITLGHGFPWYDPRTGIPYQPPERRNDAVPASDGQARDALPGPGNENV